MDSFSSIRKTNQKEENQKGRLIADIDYVIVDCRHALQTSLQTWLQSIADIPPRLALSMIAMKSDRFYVAVVQ